MHPFDESKDEDFIPNMITDDFQAYSIIRDLLFGNEAVNHEDKLELLKLASLIKARHYLGVARGEVKDETFENIAARRAVAYLKRSEKSPEYIGTNLAELLALVCREQICEKINGTKTDFRATANCI